MTKRYQRKHTIPEIGTRIGTRTVTGIDRESPKTRVILLCDCGSEMRPTVSRVSTTGVCSACRTPVTKTAVERKKPNRESGPALPPPEVCGCRWFEGRQREVCSECRGVA